MIKKIGLLFSLGICLIQIVDAQVKDEQKIIQTLKKAEIVVVVEVLEVGKEPGLWSGLIPTYQTVHYKVIEVLKGKLKDENIFVKHPVVKNSQTADKKKPQLAVTIFMKENKLILFLNVQNKQNSEKGKDCENEYYTSDENLSVLIANETTLKLISQHLF